MAVNTSRSLNESLTSGATDGKYRKVRPDTEVLDHEGHEQTLDNRQMLHPFSGYGFVTTEAPDEGKVVPGK
jgi:hypothetical protein